MSRFWLTYKSRNRLVVVIILDSSHIIPARMRAAVEGIDQGAGRELDRETAALVPETSMAAELKP